MKRRLMRGLVSGMQVAALGGLVWFAYSFGVRWAALAGAAALFLIALALDGDLP